MFGGKLKSFDDAKIAGMKGVKKVVQVGDTAVAVVADTWWHAKTALDALPIVWDEGDECQGLERIDRQVARGRPRRRAAGLRRQPERRRQGRDRRRGEDDRGGLRLPVPEPRHHGADERHRALHARTNARCGAARRTAKRRFAAVLAASGLPADKCDVHKIILGGGFGRRGADRLRSQAVRSPSRCPARRSSCYGRARKTCSTAAITRSRSAS